MYPQRLRATAIASPHPHGRKQTSAFNKKDAQIGEKDFSQANRVRMQSLSPHWHRRMEGLMHPHLNLPSSPPMSNPNPTSSSSPSALPRYPLPISCKNDF